MSINYCALAVVESHGRWFYGSRTNRPTNITAAQRVMCAQSAKAIQEFTFVVAVTSQLRIIYVLKG